jgi:hypothetical protein
MYKLTKFLNINNSKNFQKFIHNFLVKNIKTTPTYSLNKNIAKFNFSTNPQDLIFKENNEAIINRLNSQWEVVNQSKFNEAEILNFLKQIDEWKMDIDNNLVVIDKIQSQIYQLSFKIINNEGGFSIDEKNVEKILPLLIQTLYFFKIGDKSLWDKIERIYFENIENIRNKNFILL